MNMKLLKKYVLIKTKKCAHNFEKYLNDEDKKIDQKLRMLLYHFISIILKLEWGTGLSERHECIFVFHAN